MSKPSLSPVERHWQHVEALRGLYQSMPAGAGRDRVQTRYEAVLEDHRKMVAETKDQS